MIWYHNELYGNNACFHRNMDGLEAASALRKLGYAGALIGLTGYGERDQIQEFTDKGVDYVLVKPLSHMKFMKVARSKCSLMQH